MITNWHWIRCKCRIGTMSIILLLAMHILCSSHLIARVRVLSMSLLPSLRFVSGSDSYIWFFFPILIPHKHDLDYLYTPRIYVIVIVLVIVIWSEQLLLFVVPLIKFSIVRLGKAWHIYIYIYYKGCYLQVKIAEPYCTCYFSLNRFNFGQITQERASKSQAQKLFFPKEGVMRFPSLN